MGGGGGGSANDLDDDLDNLVDTTRDKRDIFHVFDEPLIAQRTIQQEP